MKHVVLSDKPVAVPSVVARDNVVLHRRAFQSSVWNQYNASLAVDGNTDGNFFAAKSCTCTHFQVNPWWTVDMGTPQHVDAVRISNRVHSSSKSVKRPVM